MEKRVSIVIPTLNEEGNLGTVLKSLPQQNFEIIIVDGHSKDNTVALAKKMRANVYFDNIGKGSALRIGVAKASGTKIIMMDADCSHIGQEIPLLLAGLEAGYDIVMGSRFLQGGGSDDITFIRKIGNKLFIFLVNLIWRQNYSDLCYGYRAFNKIAWEKLDLSQNGFGIETEISIQSAKKKLKSLEVPSYEKKRQQGNGNLKTFKDGWVVLKTIIKQLFKK